MDRKDYVQQLVPDFLDVTVTKQVESGEVLVVVTAEDGDETYRMELSLSEEPDDRTYHSVNHSIRYMLDTAMEGRARDAQ